MQSSNDTVDDSILFSWETAYYTAVFHKEIILIYLEKRIS